MKPNLIDRRTVLRTSASALAAASAWTMPAKADRPKTLRITEPYPGAVLNRRHGRMVDDGLEIRVAGIAPEDRPVEVNGVSASRNGRQFEARVVIDRPVATLIARDASTEGRDNDRIRVRWDRNSFPRYRFSIDDNSFFLREIANKRYASLFDCFYLKILDNLHEKYGAKFVLNIYYTTEDGFTLPDFPDRYKGEWKDNADWLSLSFHAHANDPARPYQDASVEKLLSDFDKVKEQILRFAGEAAWSPPTVIHWGMVPPAAFRPLAERDVRVLSGLFSKRGDAWDINYRLEDEPSAYLSNHDAWMDFESGITFSKIDIVCNNTPVPQVAPTLQPLVEDPNQAEIMDLFTHEQYFWPFYKHYVPDHAQRLDATIRWVTQRGYKPVFFHEGFLGAPL